MALIKCKECDHDVSDKAEICPNCGFKNPTATTATATEGTLLRLGGLVLLFAIGYWMIFGEDDGESRKQKTERLLAELRAIPESQYEANVLRYRELLAMYPNNERYINKLAYYEPRLKKRQIADQHLNSQEISPPTQGGTEEERDVNEELSHRNYLVAPTEDKETVYTIAVEAEELEGARVLVKVSTNIPGTIEMMVGLDLAGQAKDDVYIGTSKKIEVTGVLTEIELDVSELPKGRYIANASFYPRWGFKDGEARSSGIMDIIEGAKKIRIVGSGVSRRVVERTEKGQQWVIENVWVGTEWKPGFWRKKFGAWDEFPVTTLNPKIAKNYYFESIDMTIVVNVLRKEVVTWKMGKEGS